MFLSMLMVQPVIAVDLGQQEMRGAWISTVYRADYPSVQNDAQKQQQEFISQLEAMKAMGMNTAVVQIRPKADAFYASDINPWSEILTGTQGQNPGYDPMEFMIAQTHQRNMEFHAWMNPYRITTKGTDLNALAQNHPARLHPDWVIEYNGALYYNPAKEEVKQHICDSVAEIVQKYDVDAIHFDDYFYPSNYPLNEGETRDGAQANARRQDVNTMVQRVYQTIKNIKPTVEFGISPMGIWKNNSSDATGSATTGAEGYYSVYGDARTWIKNGWVDYIVPQIYWKTGTKAADYETLVKWWANEVQGTNVKIYIGQGIYKDDVAAEITTELDINKKYGIDGSVYFSLRDLLNNRQGCQTAVKQYYSKTEIAGANQSQENTAALPEKEEEKGSNTAEPVTPPAEDTIVPALASKASIMVDNKPVAFEVYNINDNNYFKLRDVASALSGSKKQFDTVWDEAKQVIQINPNTAYTEVDGIVVPKKAENTEAIQRLTKLSYEEKEINMISYNIQGNNFYKLRDMAELIPFGVAWDEGSQTVLVDTTKSYTE